MAVFNEPTQWEHPLGNNADTSTLPDDAAATAGIASLQKLFQIINATPLEAGGIAPDREDINALFKYLGDSIFYAMNGGIASYNAAYDYPVGALVKYNNLLYKAMQANGPGSTVAAPTDSTYWSQIPTYADLSDLMPTGVVLPFGGPTVPNGWLLANGAAISRTTYANLFDKIGTTYGAGDGSTTFNLPDLRDRFIEGAGSHALGTYLGAGLPNITGAYLPMINPESGVNASWISTNTPPAGALSYQEKVSTFSIQTGARVNDVFGGINFNANRSNSIFGNNSTVQPSSLVLNCVIKY